MWTNENALSIRVISHALTFFYLALFFAIIFSPFFVKQMRKTLAILFLIIFSLQILPLQVIGKLLSSGQNTEEVHDDGGPEDGPGAKLAKFGDDLINLYHHTPDLFASRQYFDVQVTAFIHMAESLPSVHIAEIPSPPPDTFI